MEKKSELRKALLIRKRAAEYGEALFSAARKGVSLAALVTVTFTCLFGLETAAGNDMYPAVRDGDVLLYYRGADILPNDAVVYEHEGETRIGRVAAKGGSVLSFTGDRQLTIDGAYQPVQAREGIYFPTYLKNTEGYPVTLADGEFYILNDDRERDTDSRTLGVIRREEIKGRVVTVIRRRSI